MSDSTHALAVCLSGPALMALGLLMAWHCRRSARLGELQMSAGLVVEKRQTPGWYRFSLASFVLMSAALFGTGAFCLVRGLQLL
jgi:hypothetical protein